MCSLSNERGGDVFDWSRLRGQTGSSNTGPSVDHTTGNSSGMNINLRLLVCTIYARQVRTSLIDGSGNGFCECSSGRFGIFLTNAKIRFIECS